MRRALAIIDGEHYAPVVRDALAELPYRFAAALLVGGVEKLRGGEDYGVPLADNLDEAISAYDPEVVVDLSDEPVLSPSERFLLASRVLARGLPYVGADFRLDPPPLEPFPLPSIGIAGTGKRVGKTALTVQAARLLARDRRVVVVSMGRGAPREPEVVEVPPTLESLLELSRSGRHAASDHLETAVLTRVVTVGCRRCGGGLAGAPFVSNVLEGAEIAARLRPDIVLFDGSGAAVPPVAVGARVLVAGGAQDVTAGLNPYRVLISDLVVLTGGGGEDVRDAVHAIKSVPVVRTRLRLRPGEPLGSGRVAVFTTGPAPTDHLEADVVAVSRNLANRQALHEDLARIDADVYLVEIKAAAVDVVAETALERGARVVFAENEVVPLSGEPDLEAELLGLAELRSAVRV